MPTAWPVPHCAVRAPGPASTAHPSLSLSLVMLPSHPLMLAATSKPVAQCRCQPVSDTASCDPCLPLSDLPNGYVAVQSPPAGVPAGACAAARSRRPAPGSSACPAQHPTRAPQEGHAPPESGQTPPRTPRYRGRVQAAGNPPGSGVKQYPVVGARCCQGAPI
jgi:hypothetical protein